MMVLDEMSRGPSHLTKRADKAALLAFRCARQRGKVEEVAVRSALKAYLAILPHEPNAIDKVIQTIADAVRIHPHWMQPTMMLEAAD